MKQVISSRGDVWVDDVPRPTCDPDDILVQNVSSVISLGTEKSSIKVRKKNPLKLLMDRPDLKKQVKKILSKEGLIRTYKLGMEKLREPIALGYSCAGIVMEVGKNVTDLEVGDKVACMGRTSNHSEIIVVKENLCTKLPPNVSFKEGSFGTLGAIAMQGVRRADISVGENVAVIGLGLIGNLTTQILKASGCNVVGFDIDDYKVKYSEKFCDATFNSNDVGVEDVKNTLTKGYGFDKVIITASASSNEPIVYALDLLRKKGTIVLVGVTNIEIPREPFYEKEADFLISTSYGPGRYDPEFEEKGRYMPIEYVRWNEKENLSSFLKLIDKKKIDVKSLVSKEYDIKNADTAYEELKENRKVFGVLIKYTGKEKQDKTWMKLSSSKKTKVKKEIVNVGLIGVGSFAKTYHLPNLKKIDNYNIRALCSNKGYQVKDVGKKYDVNYVSTDYKKILNDKKIDLVIISTRHNSHAKIAAESLKKHKHTFVEKPLALNQKELDRIIKIAKKSKGNLFVGFNRRFAPFTKKIKKKIKDQPGPKIINYHIKTNEMPSDHWIVDPEIGGGRIIGEMVHFIDYINYLIDKDVERISAHRIDRNNKKLKTMDDVSVSIKYKDGSIGNIVYSSLGSGEYPKEKVQVHAGNNSFEIDDFKKFYRYDGKRRKKKLWSQDKGHIKELEYVYKSLRLGKELFDIDTIYLTHKIAYRINETVRNP